MRQKFEGQGKSFWLVGQLHSRNKIAVCVIDLFVTFPKLLPFLEIQGRSVFFSNKSKGSLFLSKIIQNLRLKTFLIPWGRLLALGIDVEIALLVCKSIEVKVESLETTPVIWIIYVESCGFADE